MVRRDAGERSAGEGQPGETGAFAVRRNADGVLVGSSRYLAVRRHDRVVEIGWTWFNPAVWGTGVNVETKLLMFTAPSRRSAASGSS